MIKLMLNARKPHNYAFFCPVSRLHLTMANPVGYADGVTPYILRGLQSEAIIDVDHMTNLETGKEEAEKKQTQAPAESTADNMLEAPVETTGQEMPATRESEAPEATPEETAAETVELMVETPVDVLPVDSIPAAQESSKQTRKGGRGKKNT